MSHIEVDIALHITDIHRVSSFYPSVLQLMKLNLINRLMTILNRIKNVIELVRVLAFILSLSFHLFNNLMDLGLLNIILPKLKDPLISSLYRLLSKMLGRLPRVVGLKRVSKEVEALEHHHFRLTLMAFRVVGQICRIHRIVKLLVSFA